MKRQKLTNEIVSCLGYLSNQVQLSNSLSLNDINKHAETFYCELLNLIYEFSLTNINFKDQNAAAIDLGDVRRKIAIQVTATSTLAKIKKTRKTFIQKKLNKKYTRLIILNIGKKSKHTVKSIGTKKTIKMNLSQDVWNIDTLANEISACPVKKIEKILDFLQLNISLGNQPDEKSRKHDVAVFKKSQKILSPNDWESFFYDLWHNHFFWANEIEKFRSYIRFFRDVENEFLNDTLRDSAKKFSKVGQELLNWVSLNFFIYPNNDTRENYRSCLHPHWNIDRGGDWNAENNQKYEAANKELGKRISSTQEAYNSFRQSIKQVLYI